MLCVNWSRLIRTHPVWNNRLRVLLCRGVVTVWLRVSTVLKLSMYMSNLLIPTVHWDLDLLLHILVQLSLLEVVMAAISSVLCEEED